MKAGLTELVFILDQSGSMYNLTEDTIGGFNSMLEKQRHVKGDCKVTTVLFNDRAHTIHNRLDLQAVRPMTRKDYIPHGSTALYDAVGRTMDSIIASQRHMNPKYRASQVMFVIITDGLENDSMYYSASQIRKMIEYEKEKYGWKFIFLGANFDAEKAGSEIGIDARFTASYVPDAQGTELNFEAVSAAAACVRESGILEEDCLDEIRSDEKKRNRRRF